MTSSVYQTTIEELESILSPRVVSRSLQEGLRSVGKSPQTVVYDDLEKILKGQVYKQLQVAMPVSEAKTLIGDILNRLKQLEEEELKKSQIGEALDQQGSNLAFLKERIKPFNLYFEWSEVQKLRALIQLLDTEHSDGREANKLVNDAREQLHVVEQKLEDHLVGQARELADLEDTFDIIQSLGGPKVRRFENLINQIRNAQSTRQLAQAELERARKLSLDLRKLMESSVAVDLPPSNSSSDFSLLLSVEEPEKAAPTETVIATESNEAENKADLAAKLLQLDISNEKRELSTLKESVNILLDYQPKLAEQFQPLESKLETNSSVADELKQLSEALEQASAKQRNELKEEVTSFQKGLEQLEVDSKELEQNLHITLGVLDTTLPPLRDIEHLRRLYDLALQKNQELKQAQEEEKAALSAQLKEQEESLTGLNLSLNYHSANPDVQKEHQKLKAWINELVEAQERSEANYEALQNAREAASQLENAVAERSEGDLERERAQLRSLANELHNLPITLDLSVEAANLTAHFNGLTTTLETQTIGEEAVQDSQQKLDLFKQQLKDNYLEELKRLETEAIKLDAGSLLEQIKHASNQINERYPNLDAIEQLLADAHESKRAEQIKDLHSFETELGNYTNADPSFLEPLQAFLSKAQADLQAGQVVDDFDNAWELLDRLKQESERLSANFIPRLDSALQDYEEIIKLNTEDALRVGRILQHLDTQRDTFSKTSSAMQQKLHSSLQEAEDLINELKEQLEATRAIAGQLVNTNLLDNLFGSSDANSASNESTIVLEEPKPHGIGKQSPIPEINTWLNSYREEAGIASLLVLDDSNLHAGFSKLDFAELSKALIDLEDHFQQLGNELNLGKRQLSVIEMLNQSVISAWVNSRYQIVILVDQPATLNANLHKLRKDLPALQDTFHRA